MIRMNLDCASWVDQFKQHVCGHCRVRRILYWQIDNSSIGEKLNTSGTLVDPKANLRKARNEDEKAENDCPSDAVDYVAHRSHPRTTDAMLSPS